MFVTMEMRTTFAYNYMIQKYEIKISDFILSYFKARRHKKYARDVKIFDLFFERNFSKLIKDVKTGKYSAKIGNYCFVVYRPKPREIFGTCFTNRIVHHYLDLKLRPIYECILSPRTYNNRKGLGVLACIMRVFNDI